MAAGRSLADGLEESGLFTGDDGQRRCESARSPLNWAVVMEEIAPYYREKSQAFMSARYETG